MLGRLPLSQSDRNRFVLGFHGCLGEWVGSKRVVFEFKNTASVLVLKKQGSKWLSSEAFCTSDTHS